jgi:hypothetical protein
MSDKKPEQLLPEIMRQFTGTEYWYRHAINRKIVFTDGAKHVADCGGAYWLVDEIALNQRYNSRVAAEGFQVWTLKVDLVRKTGVLTCEDGNGNKVFEKPLEFTDFPLPEITLWFTDNTILLPSEY